MNTFANTLIEWYKRNKRALPWRATLNPYKIWISEIILQQTRVATGLLYYKQFVETFPTVNDLAVANEDEVMRLWQGLGYYSRARNLHKAAKMIVEQYHGEFPSSYDKILALPGVGPYTAAAIGSIVFGLRVPAVDGNVYRVLSRIFLVATEINTGKAHREFSALALELMGSVSPREFNQAMMEFGALQCVPKSPKCDICPFNSMCLALRNDVVLQFPKKKKPLAVKDRYFSYLVMSNGTHSCVQKRNSKDIWHSLYEFPMIESEQIIEEFALEETVIKPLLKENVINIQENSLEINNVKVLKPHKLSHQRLHITIIFVEFKGQFFSDKKIIPLGEISEYAFPKPLNEFIKEIIIKK